MSFSDSLENYENTQQYNKALARLPHEWKGPVVDVVDTFGIVRMGLKSIGIDDNFVLADAVRMVLERHDKALDADAEP
jgi:hypothetical protein